MHRPHLRSSTAWSRRRWLQWACTSATAVATAAALGLRRRVLAGVESEADRLVERLANGVEVYRVSSQRVPQSNIYCEKAYCSADGRNLVYQRRVDEPGPNRTEFVVVELGSWREERLDLARGISGCAIADDGSAFYYHKQAPDGTLALLRADLTTGQVVELYRFARARRWTSLGTISPTGRWYAVGAVGDRRWQRFDIVLVDLERGTEQIVDSDPYILNPHPQFDPGNDTRLLIQHNRGGRYSPDGKLQRLVGPEGATLYVLSVPDGIRQPLQVGKPYTTPCTGHEAWIGTTGRIALTVAASGAFAPERGNLLTVRPGESARVLARGYRFNHLAISRDGSLFVADDWVAPYRIVLGSTESGKTVDVCAAGGRVTRSQLTHPHAYVTPDHRWVVFNADRDGCPHVYAARVPDELLKQLRV